MEVTVTTQPKSQVKLNVVVPRLKVLEAYNKVVENLVKTAELPGFRPGKAPREKVVEKTDPAKLHGEVVNVLLETYYPQAVKEKLIQPISNPRVEIKEFDIEKDFEFDATVATKPQVTIGDYKAAIKKAHDEKTNQLKTQNAEKLKAGEQLEIDHVHLSPNELIEAILTVCDADVAPMLVEQETDRMLTRLVNQAEKIGLSLEKYLESLQKTAEQLRAEYEKVAEQTIKGEFVLGHLVQQESLQVSDEELLEALKASGVENAEERLKDPTEKWYIRSVLEKNKLLTKLAEEVEGKHDH